MRIAGLSLLLLILAACSSPIPNSAGVGFGDYQGYLAERDARNAALRGDPVPEGGAISNEPLNALGQGSPVAGGPPTEGEQLAAETRAALNGAPGSVPRSPAGLSDEQDFEAVTARESIESDRERLEQRRAQYEQVTPTELPTRPDSAAPNIVAYALATSHPPGTEKYPRVSLFGGGDARNCNRYSNANEAQEAFLAAGGPERDRRRLDPDGDGYACGWDPTPFRLTGQN